MSEAQPVFDGFATEMLFLDVGGVSAWNRPDRVRTPSEVEERAVEEISMALLAIANSEHTILESEQESAYKAGRDGLVFGLHVLAYNFMDRNELVSDRDFELALDHYANRAPKVAELARAGKAPDVEEDTESTEEDDAIIGFRSFIEANIDELCPEIEWQIEFLQGVMTAESMFEAIFEMKKKIENRRMELEFNQIIENFNL